MKNRRSIIISFLLCAALLVGVGYAALAENLTIDGTLAFFQSSESGLEGNLYFNGAYTIVDGSHEDITTDMIGIVNVNVSDGTQNANINAQFTLDSLQELNTGVGSEVGIILPVVVKNPTENAFTVSFGQISTSGEIGATGVATTAHFTMDTTVREAATESGLVSELTVEAGTEKVVYVHVKILIPDSTLTEIEVPAEDFLVTIPVSKITA